MRSTQSLARGAGRSGNKGVSRRDEGTRGGMRAVKDQAAETVVEVTQRLKDRSGAFIDQQKQRAVTSLEEVGNSIRETAGQLHEGPLAAVGTYVEAAANLVAGASEYLGSQDVATLRRDAERAARSRPQLFLGGMFVAGLALARFLKATQAQPAPAAPPRAEREEKPTPRRAARARQKTSRRPGASKR